MARSNPEKQNVTISVSPEIGAEEAWERSERAALALLEGGFHLGGLTPASRDELHER